jgi:hypothetical protein
MSVSMIFMIGNPTADGTPIKDINWDDVIQFFQLYASSDFYSCFDFCRKYGEIVSLSHNDIKYAIQNINTRIDEISDYIAHIQEIKTSVLKLENLGVKDFGDCYSYVMELNDKIKEQQDTIKFGYTLIGVMNVADDLLYDRRVVSILCE